MDCSTMRLFLSDENIKSHFDYINKQKLRFSILQKSCSELNSCCYKEIYRKKLPFDIKKQALTLICDIKTHELFFNSFSQPRYICKNIKRYFSSQDRLIYEMLSLAREVDYGFIFVCLDKAGKPIICSGENKTDIFIKYEPILAIDLYEHVYFKDYGFNKEKYLSNALGYLNLKILDDRLLSLDNQGKKGYNHTVN